MRRVLPNQLFSDIRIYMSKLLKSYSAKQCIHERIQAVLLYHEIRNYNQVAKQIGRGSFFVQKWNKRACIELIDWDINWSQQDKKSYLIKVFSDLPRNSGPKTYTVEDQCQVMAVALKKPEEFHREITHWTHIELADELDRSGLVKGISKSTAGRILREADIRPHKSRYWLNPTIENQKILKSRSNKFAASIKMLNN